MDWKLLVWILIFSLAKAEPKPSEGMFGEMGDLYGDAQMANHVPRLGRRSLSPFRGQNHKGFRFFGGLGDNAGERHSNLAGFFGPLFSRYENFRYYGGRPGAELARGLLRDKRTEELITEYPELIVPDNVKLDKDTAVADESDKMTSPEDEEYWKNILGEATINVVLEKMAQIGETREMIDEFNNYKQFGVGNPLPKYLARFNHQFPAAALSPKVKVESSYPSQPGHQEAGILNKYKSYLPFPRRRKRLGNLPSSSR